MTSIEMVSMDEKEKLKEQLERIDRKIKKVKREQYSLRQKLEEAKLLVENVEDMGLDTVKRELNIVERIVGNAIEQDERLEKIDKITKLRNEVVPLFAKVHETEKEMLRLQDDYTGLVSKFPFHQRNEIEYKMNLARKENTISELEKLKKEAIEWHKKAEENIKEIKGEISEYTKSKMPIDEINRKLTKINTIPNPSSYILAFKQKLEKERDEQVLSAKKDTILAKLRGSDWKWDEAWKYIRDAKRIIDKKLMKPEDRNTFYGPNSIFEVKKKIDADIEKGIEDEKKWREFNYHKSVIARYELPEVKEKGALGQLISFFSAIIAFISAGLSYVFWVLAIITGIIIAVGAIIAGIIGIIQWRRGKITGWEIILRILMGWFYPPLLLLGIVD